MHYRVNRQMLSIGSLSRNLFIAAGAWLIISGASELTTTSEGNRYGSWADETSFAALGIRSNGTLKIGLGLACLAGATVGFGAQTSGSTAGINTFSADSGDSYCKSDGTQEGDFQACSQLYMQKGGRKKPVKANSLVREDSVTLCDIYGKNLANFEKNQAREWHCLGVLL